MALPRSSRQIQIRAILATCQAIFDLASGAEVTIEANPNNLDDNIAQVCSMQE